MKIGSWIFQIIIAITDSYDESLTSALPTNPDANPTKNAAT
jgi:hypothetical protein